MALTNVFQHKNRRMTLREERETWGGRERSPYIYRKRSWYLHANNKWKWCDRQCVERTETRSVVWGGDKKKEHGKQRSGQKKGVRIDGATPVEKGLGSFTAGEDKEHILCVFPTLITKKTSPSVQVCKESAMHLSSIFKVLIFVKNYKWNGAFLMLLCKFQRIIYFHFSFA